MTSLRTANGRYSISVSGPTESRLENELKGRFCPERLRTRTSRISNSYPDFARASRRTCPTISTVSSSFKWCSLMDSGGDALHFSGAILQDHEGCFPEDTHA